MQGGRKEGMKEWIYEQIRLGKNVCVFYALTRIYTVPCLERIYLMEILLWVWLWGGRERGLREKR